MAYIREGTLSEVFNNEPDVLVTPVQLRASTWMFGGNNAGSEKTIGTSGDFDFPIIRNSVEKARFDNITWTTSSYTTNLKIGTNGGLGVIRFPLNTNAQHGFVSDVLGTYRHVIASGETSSAPIIATPIVILSGGTVGIGASPTAGFDVTGTIRLRTFATAGNLLQVNDSSGNITSVTPASILSTVGGFIQSGNTFGNTGILGTNDANALAFRTNGTEAMRILTNQFVGIGNTSPQTKLHLTGGAFRLEETNVITDYDAIASLSLTAGTTVLKTYATANYMTAAFEYVIFDASMNNMRAGLAQGVWHSGITYYEQSTTDIGDTSAITFSYAINGANAELRIIVASGTWNVKGILRAIN